MGWTFSRKNKKNEKDREFNICFNHMLTYKQIITASTLVSLGVNGVFFLCVYFLTGFTPSFLHASSQYVIITLYYAYTYMGFGFENTLNLEDSILSRKRPRFV